MTSDAGSRLVEAARGVGVVLASASTVCYASGYLVMRARANALGTDPGFTLVDQAYVAAGFRFLLVTVLALLVIAPLLSALQLLARIAQQRLTPWLRYGLGSVAALALAFLTLAGFTTLEVKSVLLGGEAGATTPIQRAVVASILGEADFGVLVTLVGSFAAVVTTVWAFDRLGRLGPKDPLALILCLMAIAQLVLLPIQHGIFYADRRARQLERPPEGVQGVIPPVWLLDRSADRASLLARTENGRFSLMTVKVDALDGIPISRTATIGEIMRPSGGSTR